MNNFKKQKQYSSCKCMYITKMQCTDEVLKNDVISRLNLYLHLYHVQKFVLVKYPDHLLRKQNFVSLPTVSHWKLRPIVTPGPPYIPRCGGLSSPNILRGGPFTSLTNARSLYA